MKIKAALVDTDREFMERLQMYCQIYFVDRLEIVLFDSQEMLKQYLVKNKVHIILAGESFENVHEIVPANMAFAYYWPTAEFDGVNGYRVISKYQKIEDAYKQILNIASEKSEFLVSNKEGDKSQVILFSSAQGGVGKTTLASAYAISEVRKGKRVCCLNLELFGESSLYFEGEAGFTLSDILFSLKSKKGNLTMKIESMIAKDSSGVNYFKSCKNAIDLLELQVSELEQFLDTIVRMQKFDVIVIDYSIDFSEKFLLLTSYADRIFILNDGTNIGNVKYCNAMDVLKIYEEKEGASIIEKCQLIFNSFSTKKNCEMLQDTIIKCLGIIPAIVGGSSKVIMQEISKNEIVNQLG